MDDELSQVFVGPPNQAELMRSVLEGNGIKAVIRGSGASAAYPINVGALSETIVLVPAEDLELARELLRPDEPGSRAFPSDEPGGGAPSGYAFRLSVMRWLAAIVLLVMIVSLATTLDLW
jgi:hypothetical protein